MTLRPMLPLVCNPGVPNPKPEVSALAECEAVIERPTSRSLIFFFARPMPTFTHPYNLSAPLQDLLPMELLRWTR